MSAVATLEPRHNPALRNLLRGAVDRSRFPVFGQIELTLRCNLRCDHCYLGEDRRREEMSTAEVLRVIDQMAEAGTIMLTLTGGEVLLRKDFATIYRHAHAQGFLLNVFTNGVLINDEHIAMFSSAPPRSLEISLYGLEDGDYAEFAHAHVTFAALDRTLRAIVAAGLPLVLKSVATATLGPKIQRMRAYAASIGAHFRFATAVHSAHDGAPAADRERPSSAQSRAFQRAVESAGCEGEATALAQETGRAMAPVFVCGAGKMSFHVDPEGVMSRCGMITNELARRVSLRERSFGEAWRYLADGLDALLPEDHPCRTCRIRTLCNRCPATHTREAEVGMCELAHERARAAGLEVAGEAPMQAYWRKKDGAPKSILQRRYHG